MGCGSSGLKKMTQENWAIQPSELKVFISTFNMGEKEPPSSSFSDWFISGADVYAVGLQESTMSPRRTQEFFEELTSYLNIKSSNYVLVSVVSSGQMRLGVIVRGRRGGSGRTSDLAVGYVVTTKENTGLGGVYANKGGIAVGLCVNATKLLFVSSHLAAHQDKIKKRNEDYAEISGGLDVGNKFIDATNDADYVFWCGDLNYRIDVEREKCIQLIEKGPAGIAQLRRKDQLNAEREEGAVFVGFDEPEIFFPPTYKYEVGTREYATEKNRVPSWCDRILFKCTTGLPEVICTEYNCTNHVMTSDHSPVYGMFLVKSKVGLKQAFATAQPATDARIVITNLRGEDLIAKDFGGTSDPYVTFWSTYLPYHRNKPLCTKIQKSTINPKWPDKDIPILRALYTDLQVMYDHPIVLGVMDYDFGNADDSMGQTHLNLRDTLTTGEKTMFRLPLISHGLPAGFLAGEVQVISHSTGKPLRLKRELPAWRPSFPVKNIVPLHPGHGIQKKGAKGSAYNLYGSGTGYSSSGEEEYYNDTKKPSSKTRPKPKTPMKNARGTKYGSFSKSGGYDSGSDGYEYGYKNQSSADNSGSTSGQVWKNNSKSKTSASSKGKGKGKASGKASASRYTNYGTDSTGSASPSGSDSEAHYSTKKSSHGKGKGKTSGSSKYSRPSDSGSES